MLSTVIEAEMMGMWLSRQVCIIADEMSKRFSNSSSSMVTFFSAPPTRASNAPAAAEPKLPWFSLASGLYFMPHLNPVSSIEVCQPSSKPSPITGPAGVISCRKMLDQAMRHPVRSRGQRVKLHRSRRRKPTRPGVAAVEPEAERRTSPHPRQPRSGRRRRRSCWDVPVVGLDRHQRAVLVVLRLVFDLHSLEDELTLLRDVAFFSAAVRHLGDVGAFHRHREVGLRTALARRLHHLELHLREVLARADVAHDHRRRGVEVVLGVHLAGIGLAHAGAATLGPARLSLDFPVPTLDLDPLL